METFFNKTDKLYDVVVIRSLAILLVVAFHAYGLMMTDAIFQNAQVYRDMYSNLNNIVLAFRMPLFIFISGYLFSHLENDRGKYATFRGLVSNKFKRLIIPYFVFVTLMMLGMNDFHVSTYWQMNYYHLWFIPMLFWCFVFCRVQSFLPFCKSATFKIAMLCLFGGLASAGSRIELPNFLGINYFLIWFFWFFLGYNIYLQRDRVYGFLSHSRWILFVFLAVYSIGVYYRCTVEHNKLIMTISNLGFVFFLWYIINRLINLRGG